MIQEFVSLWDKNKDKLRLALSESKDRYCSYEHLLKLLVANVLHDEEEYGSPDPDRIHQIDDGHYQGTIFFIVGAAGYQPSQYWATKVGYGSCSGCDTMQAIMSDGDYDSDKYSEKQIDDLMTLALHMLQRFKEV